MWSNAGLYGHGVVLKLLGVAMCGNLPVPTSMTDDGDDDDDVAAGADFRADDEPVVRRESSSVSFHSIES